MSRDEIKVIGLLGSLHRRGNTEQLLDGFLQGATDAGGSVEKIPLGSLSFGNCRGCNACHTTGDCVLQDDVPDVYDRLLHADVLVISSPIYTMGITADLKGFVDRAHYLWVRGFKLNLLTFPPNRKEDHFGYFLSTAGMDREDVFDTTFPMMRALFNILGFAYCDNILAKDLDRYGGLMGHPEIRDRSYHAGQEAVLKIRNNEPCLKK